MREDRLLFPASVFPYRALAAGGDSSPGGGGGSRSDKVERTKTFFGWEGPAGEVYRDGALSKRLFAILTSCFFFWSLLPGQSREPLFSGNESFSDAQLLAVLTSPESGLTSSLFLRQETRLRGAAVLEAFYHRQGYPLARVRLHSVAPGGGFQIIEGPKARVGRVEFRGQQAFAKKQLAKLAGLEGRYDPARVQQALERLRRAYFDQGYLEVAVGPVQTSVVEVQARDHFPVPFRSAPETQVQLLIPIREGPQYHYGKVELPEELVSLDLDPPCSGEIFRERDVEAFQMRVETHFRREGQVTRRVSVVRRLDRKARKVDLQIRYVLLPPMIVSTIRFLGNEEYPDSFYRRELRLKEQDVLEAGRLEESLENLRRTGVLASAQVELQVRDREEEVDLLFRLQERDRQGVAYSFGADGMGGTESTLFYSIFNLLGLGEEIGLDVSVGSRTNALLVSVASRYLFGTSWPVTAVLRFFRRSTGFTLPDAGEAVKDLLRLDRMGLSLGAAYRFRSNQEAGILFTGERVRTTRRAAHFVLEPFWHKTDTRGGFLYQQVSASQRISLFEDPLDSWNLRSSLDFRRYFPGDVETDPVFAFRVQGAHARFFGKDSPVLERLFPAPPAIRGFDPFSSGPWAMLPGGTAPVGGDTLLVLNAEYRAPLHRHVSLVPFLDTGFNGTTGQSQSLDLLDSTDKVWRMSLGGELQLQLPAGLPSTRLIFAWNPWRLDEEILARGQGARLRDPAGAFRVAFGPSF